MNNGILRSHGAMPFKPITVMNGSMFSRLRKQKRNDVTIARAYNDASTLTQVRKINALKPRAPNTALSYKSENQYTAMSHRRNLRRVGAAAPPKKGAY